MTCYMGTEGCDRQGGHSKRQCIPVLEAAHRVQSFLVVLSEARGIDTEQFYSYNHTPLLASDLRTLLSVVG